MNRQYPGFIIDRNRLSKYSEGAYDFIVCTDNANGFIARARKVNRFQFDVYDEKIDSLKQSGEDYKLAIVKFENVGVVVEVIKIYSSSVDKPKIKSLLKKAVKHYLEAEVEISGVDGNDIEKQIGVVQEMKRLSEEQYDNLVLNNGKKAADNIILYLQQAVESLQLFKSFLCKANKDQN